MSVDTRAGLFYPPGYAFVVQLRSDSSVETGQIGGRVEHVVSGRVSHFTSLESLFAFMADILQEKGHI